LGYADYTADFILETDASFKGIEFNTSLQIWQWIIVCYNFKLWTKQIVFKFFCNWPT
jgi:hypothetical protein